MRLEFGGLPEAVENGSSEERGRSKTRHAVTQKRLINRSIYNPKQAMPFEENTARVYTSHVWSEKTIMENNNEGNW